MNHLIINKHWELNKEYNKEKLLYFLIDRPTIITHVGSFIWRNNKGQSHREYDLPAYIGKSGYISWWKNNKRHRENNKPTYIHFDGKKEYWLNGKFTK